MIRLLAILFASAMAFSSALADSMNVPGITPNANGQVPSMSSGVAPSTIYVPTAAQTIATTSETSLFSSTGSGPGQTVAASVQYAGNRFWFHAGGVITTPVGGGTVTLKIKYGSTAVLTVSGVALSISLTNQPWVYDAYCTIRTVSGTPSSSTMSCSGDLIGATTTPQAFANTSAVNIDTTTSAKIDTTWTWASVTTQTLTETDSHVQIMY
jgi:hypothetical protein